VTQGWQVAKEEGGLLVAGRRCHAHRRVKESVFSSEDEATLVLQPLLALFSVQNPAACKAWPTFEQPLLERRNTTSHTACAVSRFSCAERHTQPRRLATRPPLGHTPTFSAADASHPEFSLSC
jgi:hypothetical protein